MERAVQTVVIAGLVALLGWAGFSITRSNEDVAVLKAKTERIEQDVKEIKAAVNSLLFKERTR